MKVFHTINNHKYNVATTVFSTRKRLFCILDRNTDWNLSVSQTNRKQIHFRMNKIDADHHMMHIKIKREALELYNKSKGDAYLRRSNLYASVCSSRPNIYLKLK